MKAPIFIKIDQYREVVELMGVIRNKINEVKVNLNKIQEIKAQQESELAMWNSKIHDIEEKIKAIDNVILAPR